MLRRIALVLLILGIFSPQISKADHIYGADISYVYESGSTYTVKVNFYRDCNGIQYTNSQTLSYGKDSSTSYSSASISLGVAQDITPLGPGACSACHTSGCSFGIQQILGSVTIDLSGISGCNVRFMWSNSSRSALAGNGNWQDFYIYALLNRCSAGNHSSPVFAQVPLITGCVGQCITNYQYCNADKNDSLVYLLTPALQDNNTLITYNAGYNYLEPVKYDGSSPNTAWNTTTCKGFHLNKYTGEMNFKPMSSEVEPIAFKVEQWHKNSTGKYIKVGEIRRDADITITNCSKKAPEISFQSDTLHVCSGFQKQFSIATSESDNDSTFLNVTLPVSFASVTKTKGKHESMSIQLSPTDSDISSTHYRMMVIASNHNSPMVETTQQMFAIFVDPPMPEFSLSNINNGCGNFTIALGAKTKWSGLIFGHYSGNNVLKQADSTFSFHYNTNGIHTERFVIYTQAGCFQLLTDTIYVNDLPFANAGSDTGICKGDTIRLHGSGGVKYLWSPAYNISDTTAQSPMVWPDSSTQYVVKVTDAKGCTAIDTVFVDASGFKYTLSRDVEICPKRFTILSATGPSGATYKWYPATGLSNTTDSVVVARPDTTTTYYVQISNSHGCYRVGHIKVVLPTKTDLGPDLTICRGDSVQLHAHGGIGYTWDAADGIKDLHDPTPYVSPSADVHYNVTIKDSGGCVWSTGISVKVIQNTLSHSGDTVICPGDTATLSAGGASTYAWHVKGGATLSTKAALSVSPSTTTTYYVDLKDNVSGCTRTNGMTVTVDNDCVWPGDANVDRAVNYFDILNLGVAYGSKGAKRAKVSNTWHPYKASSWGKQTFYGVDYKHMDSNGDGVIDMKDTVAIQQNYTKDSVKYTGSANAADSIMLVSAFDRDTFYAGDTVTSRLYAGSASHPVKGLYGIAFEMNYSNPYAVAGTEKAAVVKNFLCPDGNCLLMPGKNVFTNQLSAGFVRNNGKAVVGHGSLATVSFVLHDSTYHYSSQTNTLSFAPLHAKCIDSTGREFIVVIQPAKAIVLRKHDTTGIAQLNAPGKLSVYPNPVHDMLNVSLSSNGMKEIVLSNSIGQTVLTKAGELTEIQTINVSGLSAGVYIITVRSAAGVYQQKIFISR